MIHHESRLPHHLRFIIFLLRVALGVNFFYLGFSVLFNNSLESELRERSLNSLYAWLASPGTLSSLQIFAEWAFLIIGACLVLGLFTRFVSFVAIGVTIASYWPTINYLNLSATQLVNDTVIIALCLLVLIFANAGRYLSLDMFFHFGMGRKKQP